MAENVPLVDLRTVEGYQHANDQYYYRPLIFGKNLFTYVAHVPPGGDMPADAEEAELFELSLYMLAGSLEITYGDQHFVMQAHSALYIPKGVPLGVRNSAQVTASFVLSFFPPPDIASLDKLRQRFLEKNKRIMPAEEMNRLAGIL